MIIEIKTFKELSTEELYTMLQLRSEVFVVEQNCVYQDLDGKDRIAIHVLGSKNGQLVAYTRIFGPGDYFKEASIGRVLAKKEERMYGYGRDIMEASLQIVQEHFGTIPVRISAQKYLLKFYNSLGFVQTGKEYLEDGIPHIAMVIK
ncbi:Protein ElaA [Arenibacter antarcticus]|uniref:GNAT family N-acetyltransferase n=1 Tax=Arenibacter antarcticus TaxID=2040469 RepID=A0ABW5V923_9FLAO|nr:GNAT family N-acetyltransferase [Arenibacter sp. H213]MCM4167841.1 GNAT family N-acetyltransferase [Arenibacter sp. H213]